MDPHKASDWFSLSMLVWLIGGGWIFRPTEYRSLCDGSQQRPIVPGVGGRGGLAWHDVFRKPLMCFYSNWLCILPSQITHEARLQKTINSSMLISKSRARLHQPGCFFLPNYCAIKPMTALNPVRASFYELPHTFLQHGKQTVNTRNVLHFNGWLRHS